MNTPTPPKNNTQLIQLIRQTIQEQGGSIAFSHYMELALYTKNQGYYSQKSQLFGKHGDFTTAPELSPLFAKCVARQCTEIFSKINEPDILEIGAGSGIFAVELLLELEKQQSLPTHYFIYDISESLRALQHKRLTERCPHLMNRVTWLTALPSKKIAGVIFANEVLDALPVDRFQIDNQHIFEQGVTIENNVLIWKKREPSPPLKN